MVIQRSNYEQQAELKFQYPTTPFMLELPGMSMAVLPPSEVELIRPLPETVVSIK